MAIKLELELKEAELAVAGLYKLPMEVAEPIVNKIKAQAMPQIAQQQAEINQSANPSAQAQADVTNDINAVKANPNTQAAIDEAQANSDSMSNE